MATASERPASRICIQRNQRSIGAVKENLLLQKFLLRYSDRRRTRIIIYTGVKLMLTVRDDVWEFVPHPLKSLF
jgi:hypothetical protein